VVELPGEEQMPADGDSTPRGRDASVQLDVRDDVGSEAMLREAMDPANRSLTDALQLSFRVLQLAIIVLFVLFLFSGFRTIEGDQAGVATLWGHIEDSSGLEPGLQMNWPPPVGDFIVFQAEGRTVDDGRRFMPDPNSIAQQDIQVSRASATDRIKPGRDGSFITALGEIAHISVSARYDVVDAVSFLESMSSAEAQNIVRLSLQRAVVDVGARHTLGEIRDDMSGDDLRELIQQSCQGFLDGIDSGIRLVEVSLLSDPNPPLFIQQSFEEYSRVRQQVEADVEAARQAGQEVKIAAAGEHYAELASMLTAYETQWDANNETAMAETMAKMDAILKSGRISGDAFRAISSAGRYETQVEDSVGGLARRFEGLLPAWRETPELVKAKVLLDVRGSLYGADDAETVQVPFGLGSMTLNISGLQHVRDIRRRADMTQREQDTWRNRPGSDMDLFKRVEELKGDAAARQLRIDDSGRLRGMRENN
jgi:regulator of protease activity HflC (stomatin/prohibitin superfamily)